MSSFWNNYRTTYLCLEKYSAIWLPLYLQYQSKEEEEEEEEEEEKKRRERDELGMGQMSLCVF